MPPASVTSDIPDDVECAPCETCTESGEDETVTLLETVLEFVKTEGNRGGGCVAVFLDIYQHLAAVDAETTAYSLDDAEFCLV